jgi:nitroreductase
MNKPAETQYPIHDLLNNRWSPRAFSRQAVPIDQILSLFEAARWAPSSMNLQPWSFILTSAANPEAHAKLTDSLGEFNRIWAKEAPVLVLSVVHTEREPGKPNGSALYDLGQAVAHLSVQASALGLYVHQMGGFDQQKAREAFALPENFNPVTVLAIGHIGEPDNLPPQARERELMPRARKPLSEVVFDGAWRVPLVEEKQTNPGD